MRPDRAGRRSPAAKPARPSTSCAQVGIEHLVMLTGDNRADGRGGCPPDGHRRVSGRAAARGQGRRRSSELVTSTARWRWSATA